MRYIASLMALLALAAVAMAALGDHFILPQLEAPLAKRFATALTYHQLYSLFGFVLSLLVVHLNLARLYQLAAVLLLLGVVLFSGSLYLSLLPDYAAITAVAPYGGMTLMAAWLVLAVAVVVKKKPTP
jgi:uncharacterized membrane protein YgdD (TMEM256/DUF423 family)